MSTSGESLGQVALPSTRLHHIASRAIPEQSYEIRIWLPPGHHDSPDGKYPALYVLDGDYCFGMAVDIVRYLTRGDCIPELVIAAVGYGSDRAPEEGGRNMRSVDLAPFEMPISAKPRAEAFRLFLQEELIPFVESTYHTDSALRALYGFSLGGLFGLWEMFHRPSLFSRYILASPPLNPSTAELLVSAERFISSQEDHPVKVYLCSGELDPILPWFPRLTATLERCSLPGFHFQWEVFPRGIHPTAPAEALAKGLRAAFGKKSIYEAMYRAYQEGGIAAATGLYHDLRAQAPTEYDFAESELNNFGYLLLYRDHPRDAIDVLQLNVAAYPEAWNAYDSLGEALMAAGHTTLAIESYTKSVELNPKNEFGLAQLQKLKNMTGSQAQN